MGLGMPSQVSCHHFHISWIDILTLANQKDLLAMTTNECAFWDVPPCACVLLNLDHNLKIILTWTILNKKSDTNLCGCLTLYYIYNRGLWSKIIMAAFFDESMLLFQLEINAIETFSFPLSQHCASVISRLTKPPALSAPNIKQVQTIFFMRPPLLTPSFWPICKELAQKFVRTFSVSNPQFLAHL